MKVAAIVLAAGASTRLGTPKQLVQLQRETLLERTVRVVVEAGLHPVFGVVSPGLFFGHAPQGMLTVINHEAAKGMASSIATGIRALVAHDAPVDGVVILACDQPAVTAQHLRELTIQPDEVVASTYAGRRGVPAYFPGASFHSLLALSGDVGARDLLQGARAVHLPNGELDIDTIEDLQRARNLYAT